MGNSPHNTLQAFLNDYCNDHSEEGAAIVRSAALCAQAMGLEYRLVDRNEPCHTVRLRNDLASPVQYYPIEHDGQAMALVKRFMLKIDGFAKSAEFPFDDQDNYLTFSDESLNRAIVECVAQRQAAINAQEALCQQV